MVWRIGQNYKIHVYEGDEPVATFMRPDYAAVAVAAVNDGIREHLDNTMSKNQQRALLILKAMRSEADDRSPYGKGQISAFSHAINLIEQTGNYDS